MDDAQYMNGSEFNVTFLAGRFEIDQTQSFEHVPFEVPAGTSQMRIQLSYNDQISADPTVVGGNVLDVGVFDANGTEAGGAGFRGWSGSNKLDLVIGEDWATPPYRAGDVQEGTWHLLLGPYKIGPNGLEWNARIEFDPDPRIPDAFPVPKVDVPELPPDLPEALPGWYRGDLHAHTVYSDGSAFPVQVAAAARTNGLDFFGITDHNRAQSPVAMIPTGEGWPVFVPGVEVTTYAGHFNVWGTDSWYDFRQPDAEGLQRALDAAKADGGFVSMNHPKPFGPPWEYPEVEGFEAIEVWNGWWNKLNNVSTRVWDYALRAGKRLPPIGGSDMHRLYGPTRDDNPFVPAALGYPTTWIRTDAPLSASSIIAALRAGDVFISESPYGPQVEFTLDGSSLTATVLGARGDVVVVIDQTGAVAAQAVRDDRALVTLTVPEESEYVRVEIHRPTGGVRAITNAIFR